jgi:hypothetical protein
MAPGILILTLFIVALAVVAGEGESDPVLEFYCDRARHAFDSRNPFAAGTAFSFRATSYLKQTGSGGEVGHIDTVTIDYYYSWGELDSSVNIAGDPDPLDELDFAWPNVFAEAYRFSLYPNDTGGGCLAIGFETDSIDDRRPTGLALINRELYYPCWLFLRYPYRESHSRYSRSMRFIEMDGLVFPDSVWVIGAKPGIFFEEHYRLETGITRIKIIR